MNVRLNTVCCVVCVGVYVFVRGEGREREEQRNKFTSMEFPILPSPPLEMTMTRDDSSNRVNRRRNKKTWGYVFLFVLFSSATTLCL